ncbi:unnamed protein product [Menidia menidia]|uniref:(Atlantic silverside) hypothetical protein n=1 Tax=Menidia menidia TaxID=238744 RepID=A0A8S4B0J5_9TELE|nr:unnamed protein product [Menidia menidia]
MEDGTALRGVLRGKYYYKKLPDGTLDKNRVLCNLCHKEYAYQGPTSSLRRHIRSKHGNGSRGANPGSNGPRAVVPTEHETTGAVDQINLRPTDERTKAREWTQEDLLKLLEALKAVIPTEASRFSYHKGLKVVDWTKVAFPPYSPEQCQEKWTCILKKMSKIRSLPELIVQAEEVISAKELHVDGTEDDDLPPRPISNCFALFCKEMSEASIHKPGKEFLEWLANRWRDLSETERTEYRARCTESKKEYIIKLEEYLKRFDEVTQQKILKRIEMKRKMSQIQTKKRKTEPRMPCRGVNNVFLKETMELLKDTVPVQQDRFVQANKMWHNISPREKELLKAKVNLKMKKYAVELKEWFETLTSKEQEEYRKCNPYKSKFLDDRPTGMSSTNGKSLHPSQPSDSEDEDMVVCDSSSDEDLHVLDFDKEEDQEDNEEEEEDEDDIFKLF